MTAWQTSAACGRLQGPRGNTRFMFGEPHLQSAQQGSGSPGRSSRCDRKWQPRGRKHGGRAVGRARHGALQSCSKRGNLESEGDECVAGTLLLSAPVFSEENDRVLRVDVDAGSCRGLTSFACSNIRKRRGASMAPAWWDDV